MVTGAGGGCDYGMGWVRGDEGSGKELGGEEGEVVVHWEDNGFCVKMVHAGHLHEARADMEGSVLEGLKFADAIGAGIREPDGRGVREEAPNEGFVS